MKTTPPFSPKPDKAHFDKEEPANPSAFKKAIEETSPHKAEKTPKKDNKIPEKDKSDIDEKVSKSLKQVKGDKKEMDSSPKKIEGQKTQPEQNLNNLKTPQKEEFEKLKQEVYQPKNKEDKTGLKKTFGTSVEKGPKQAKGDEKEMNSSPKKVEGQKKQSEQELKSDLKTPQKEKFEKLKQEIYQPKNKENKPESTHINKSKKEGKTDQIKTANQWPISEKEDLPQSKSVTKEIGKKNPEKPQDIDKFIQKELPKLKPEAKAIKPKTETVKTKAEEAFKPEFVSTSLKTIKKEGKTDQTKNANQLPISEKEDLPQAKSVAKEINEKYPETSQNIDKFIQKELPKLKPEQAKTEKTQKKKISPFEGLGKEPPQKETPIQNPFTTLNLPQDVQMQAASVAASTQADSILPAELMPLFEHTIGTLIHMEKQDVSTTQVILNNPGFAFSRFYGTKVTFERFSTAPNSYNISFTGSTEAINVISKNVQGLYKTLNGSDLGFKVNDIKAEHEPMIFKRKPAVGQDQGGGV